MELFGWVKELQCVPLKSWVLHMCWEDWELGGGGSGSKVVRGVSVRRWDDWEFGGGMIGR